MTLRLAMLCLRHGDAAGAIALFTPLAETQDTPELWAGLAAAHRLAGDAMAAAAALGRALSRHPLAPPLPELAPLVAAEAGLPGWCGLRPDGRLVVESAGRASLTLDGRALALPPDGRMPPRDRRAALLTATADGRALLGSPLDLASRRAGRPQAAPAGPANRALAARRWRQARGTAGAVVMITHADGGGVERFVDARAAIHRRAGLRPILLQPSPRGERAADAPGDCIVDGAPGLRFHLPAELPALARLLAAERPVHLELHHLLGHHPALLSLAELLGIPWDAYVHDYAAICPRVTLVGAAGRYCGEPELAGCEACIAACGSLLEETVTVAGLRRRSADWLERARTVIAPSEDAARRLRRHLPRLRPQVMPWEDAQPAVTAARRRHPRARICVAGAIGVEKGFDVLLACARDAAARGLPLDFVVVGHTIDDAALFATGRVFVTGPYRPDEAVALLAAQQAELGFLPSVWPESWSYVLTELWQAGLAVVAFDIGAPAERIRRAGGGHLLPLAASTAAINDALLRLSVPLHTTVEI